MVYDDKADRQPWRGGGLGQPDSFGYAPHTNPPSRFWQVPHKYKSSTPSPFYVSDWL